MLQVLQSGGVRGRWTLKSPHHAIALEHLTAVYPDARLVLLHRDPVVLTASVCSLITTLSSTFTDADHRAYIASSTGRRCSRSRCVASTRSATRTRSTRSSTCSTPTSSPIRAATVASIYRACGDELDDSARRRSRTTSTAHPKGQFGAHRYDVAEFGLDAGELAERFAGYIDRYAVPRESSG